MALVSTLTDLFTATTLDAAKWSLFTAASGTATASGAGYALNYPNPTSTSNDADISSVATYSLVASAASINVVSAPVGTNSDATFALQAGGATNRVHWQQEGTSLFAAYIIAGSQTILATLTYNPLTHAYWRIREGIGGLGGGIAGNTYWDTSVDGLTWTQRATVANPITLTALTVLLAATSFGSDANLRPFQFRYFNTPISEGMYNHLRVGDGMSVSGVAN